MERWWCLDCVFAAVAGLLAIVVTGCNASADLCEWWNVNGVAMDALL